MREKLAEKRNQLLEIAFSFEELKLDIYSYRNCSIHRQIKPELLPSLSHHILVLHCISQSLNSYSHKNRPCVVQCQHFEDLVRCGANISIYWCGAKAGDAMLIRASTVRGNCQRWEAHLSTDSLVLIRLNFFSATCCDLSGHFLLQRKPKACRTNWSFKSPGWT